MCLFIMDRTYSYGDMTRIIQEIVPGRQITIAHVIANPDEILYQKLGLDPAGNEKKGAIGIVTITPAETAIIIADVALKASGVTLEFVDRFSGTLLVTGSISEVESGLFALLQYTKETLGFTVCGVTKT